MVILRVSPFYRIGFFLAGIGALVLTFWWVGIRPLVDAFSILSGSDFLVFLFYPAVMIWDAWGWRYAFPKSIRPKLRSTDLFWIRLAGEAVNTTTPFFDVGGEPLKVFLLARRTGLDRASTAAGTIAARFFLQFSEAVFWMGGLVPILCMEGFSVVTKIVLVSVSVVVVLFCLFLLLEFKRGFFISLVKRLERIGLTKGLLQRFEEPLRKMDDTIATVCCGPSASLVPAFVLHFIGWVVGGLETYLMFAVLGAPVSLTQAVIIEALLQLTRSASVFIPGSMGVQEAGMGLYASWFAASPSLGVAVSLLKRARQLLWSAIGFAAWGYYARSKNL